MAEYSGPAWLGRAVEHGVSPPGLIARAPVESLAAGPSDVAGTGASPRQQLRGPGDQGSADTTPVQWRRHAHAANGPGSRAEHGREDRIRVGPSSSRVPAILPALSRAIKV